MTDKKVEPGQFGWVRVFVESDLDYGVQTAQIYSATDNAGSYPVHIDVGPGDIIEMPVTPTP